MPRPAPQLALPLAAAPSAALDKLPPPSEDEKRAQRVRQNYLCATCGKESNGRALNVVRAAGGALLAFCRKHRLMFDATLRCRKGASKRHRGVKVKVKRPRGQRKLGIA